MNSARRALVLLCASLISILCGTLYIFSAYSPQIAIKLQYSASQTSTIAIFGQIGAIISGPLCGLLIDKTGYTISITMGSVLISSGYYLFRNQFQNAYSNLFYSCVLYFAIGCGSTAINAAAIKCCMVSFPNMRGLATALPIACYGASASIYSMIGASFYPGRTTDFLGFICYSSVAVSILTAPLICLCDREHKVGRSLRSSAVDSPAIEMVDIGSPQLNKESINHITSSLNNSSYVFIHFDFWILTVILGILAGLGQMYIYSVGYMVTALVGGTQFIRDNASIYRVTVQQQQQFQVGIISIASCLGRISSGFVSDMFHSSTRIYLILVPTILCMISQFLGYSIEDLKYVGILSGLVGFGYGFMYCIFPIIVGDLWGLQSFSFNWGVTNLTPIVTNLVVTHFFGKNYDSNTKEVTVTLPDSQGVQQSVDMHICELAAGCYNRTFEFTIFLSITTLLIVIALIRRQLRPSAKKRRFSF